MHAAWHGPRITRDPEVKTLDQDSRTLLPVGYWTKCRFKPANVLTEERAADEAKEYSFFVRD